MLSPSQEEAVCHGSGPCLTLAGRAVARPMCLPDVSNILLQKGGVPPEQILVITLPRPQHWK